MKKKENYSCINTLQTIFSDEYNMTNNTQIPASLL